METYEPGIYGYNIWLICRSLKEVAKHCDGFKDETIAVEWEGGGGGGLGKVVRSLHYFHVSEFTLLKPPYSIITT